MTEAAASKPPHHLRHQGVETHWIYSHENVVIMLWVYCGACHCIQRHDLRYLGESFSEMTNPPSLQCTHCGATMKEPK